MVVDKTLIGIYNGEVLASAEDKEKNFGTECSIKLTAVAGSLIPLHILYYIIIT